MKTLNTDYLTFDAYSMKNAIVKKLAENPYFTDFVFEDSNLTTLIDTFSHMFQTLTYYLNHAASESMFIDTQLYENMHRIVKLLNYNPSGFTTSTLNVKIGIPTNLTSVYGKQIPKFTYVRAQSNDADGSPIYYSTINYAYLNAGDDNYINLYNGQWKLYNRTFVANGIPNEVFMLPEIYSDHTKKELVAYPHVHVFVKRTTDDSHDWISYTPVTSGLFFNGDTRSTYTPSSKVFELQLNEYKQIMLKFGDGVYGEKLKKNDEIYVVYLKANNNKNNAVPLSTPKGAFNKANTQGNIRLGIAGMDTATFIDIHRSIDNISDLTLPTSWPSTESGELPAEFPQLWFENDVASTLPSNEETVAEIKRRAPAWFKSSGRLITTRDFEYYIKSHPVWRGSIIDIEVMNNSKYMSTFYRWLYNLELSAAIRTGTRPSYLNPRLRSQYEYYWADACDFNNVYLFIKYSKAEVEINDKYILDDLSDKKCLTAEPVIMRPVTKFFAPCALTASVARTRYTAGLTTSSIWDTHNENYIEITVDTSSTLSPAALKSRAVALVSSYFNVNNQQLGSLIDVGDLTSQLLAIDGIKDVRTVCKEYNETTKTYDKVLSIVNGLSFAAFTPIIVSGEDLDIVTGTHQLEPFQFPELVNEDSDIANVIKVILDSTYQHSTVEF